MSREYPCVHYEDGKCKKYTDEQVTSYCVKGPCDDETPSIADKIRAMSDEELAVEMIGIGIDNHIAFCQNRKECLDAVARLEIIPAKKCKECLVAWLQQPAEEVKNNA